MKNSNVNSVVDQRKLTKSAFYEVQRFRKVWVMLVVLSVTGLQWTAAVQQLLRGKSFGQNQMPDSMAFFFWIIFGIGLPIIFFYSRLITEVRADGIYFRFIPFHRSYKRIAFVDLEHCELRTFNAIIEYGGWGMRWMRKGTAYLVSGNCGVLFELEDRKRMLIGSQRADEFWQAIPAKVRTRTRNRGV